MRQIAFFTLVLTLGALTVNMQCLARCISATGPQTCHHEQSPPAPDTCPRHRTISAADLPSNKVLSQAPLQMTAGILLISAGPSLKAIYRAPEIFQLSPP